MNIPLISIVVPVYNSDKYLCKCLDSLCNQTFKDFEILLIDDGSSDKSGEICDEYAKTFSNIIVIHKNNEGVSVARNTGIKNANAPWICFVDSDDWVENNYLRSFVDAIGSADFISQNIVKDNETKGKSVLLFEYKDDNFNISDCKIATYRLLHNGVPYAKLFKRSVILENGIYFDKRISFHEDHIFVLKYLSYINNIQLLESHPYHYIYHGAGSLSSRYNDSEELIVSSDELVKQVDLLIYKLSPNVRLYVNDLLRSYGQYQLICACKNVKYSNYKMIFRECNARFLSREEYLSEKKIIYNYIKCCVKFKVLYTFLFVQLRFIRLINFHRNTN